MGKSHKAKDTVEQNTSRESPINVNLYSLASYYVEPFFNDIKLSKATCFFTRRNGKLYLVTNWHVVSGMDADTRCGLSSMGARPNKLRVYLPKKLTEGTVSFDEDGFFDVSLYKEDTIAWYEKEKDGKMIDVAVIPITEEIPNFVLPIEDAEEPFNESTTISIASEIFVIGFPFGRIGGVIPVWKRASVASEPELDMDDMPYFFADTATRDGMSGSPVIVYKDRPVTMINQKEGSFSRHVTKFVGIYSGRIGAESNPENSAQLGRIWKADTINNIIALYEA